MNWTTLKTSFNKSHYRENYGDSNPCFFLVGLNKRQPIAPMIAAVWVAYKACHQIKISKLQMLMFLCTIAVSQNKQKTIKVCLAICQNKH